MVAQRQTYYKEGTFNQAYQHLYKNFLIRKLIIK